MPSILEEEAFETLLESGNFDAAARQLFAPPTTVFIETSVGDSPRAVVGCAILKRPVDGTGETAAAAILDSWAKWLVTLRLEFGSDLDDDPVPASPAPIPICRSACPGLG